MIIFEDFHQPVLCIILQKFLHLVTSKWVVSRSVRAANLISLMASLSFLSFFFWGVFHFRALPGRGVTGSTSSASVSSVSASLSSALPSSQKVFQRLFTPETADFDHLRVTVPGVGCGIMNDGGPLILYVVEYFAIRGLELAIRLNAPDGWEVGLSRAFFLASTVQHRESMCPPQFDRHSEASL